MEIYSLIVLEARRPKSMFSLLPCLFQLVVTPDIPWLVAASLQSLPPSLQGLLLLLSPFLSLIRTLAIGFMVHLDNPE